MVAQTSVDLAIPSGLTDSGSPTKSSFTVSYVPAPASLGLLIAALASLGLMGRRIRF